MSALNLVLARAILAAVGFGLVAASVPLARTWLSRTRRLVLAQAHSSGSAEGGQPRILYFSGSYCVDCRARQAPALEKLTREMAVEVEEIDAAQNPELLRRYRVALLPTTVVLDAAGVAREINYGFTDEVRLASQLRQLTSAAAA